MNAQIKMILLVATACAASSFLLAGCVFGGASGVDCGDLSSSKWKSLESEDRQDEAKAIKDCGTLDGMSRSEVAAWMGEPSTLGNQDSWTTADGLSDVPTITVQFENGTVDEVIVNGD